MNLGQEEDMNVYDFTVKTMDGKDVALSSYKEKYF